MKLDVGLSVEGNHLPSVATVARAAEEIGIAGLWTAETKHDAFLPLLLAAEHTQRLELGTAVAIAFSRSPMAVAQTAWDLQAFSNGRFILGLGTQVKAHIERRFSMPWDAPVGRLRDYITALRAIWRSFRTDAPLNYQGQFYQHTLLTPFFNPGPIGHPDIPIAVAGVNTGLARLAGEACQGFHIHPFHSPTYIRQIIQPAISEGAAQAGRSSKDVSLITSAFVVTGHDATTMSTQREQIRSQIAFYASTPSYRVMLEAHGWQEVGERLSRLAAAKRWHEMPPLISDEMLHTFAIEAAPDEVGAALHERYDGVIDRVALYLPFTPGTDDAFWHSILQALE